MPWAESVVARPARAKMHNIANGEIMRDTSRRQFLRFLGFVTAVDGLLDWQGVASMMAVGRIKLEFLGRESGFHNTP